MDAIEKDLEHMNQQLKENGVEIKINSGLQGVKVKYFKPKKDGHVVSQEFYLDDVMIQAYGITYLILRKMDTFLLYYSNVYGD
jgi:hypothetical protein